MILAFCKFLETAKDCQLETMRVQQLRMWERPQYNHDLFRAEM